jgi:hypothetical protein
MGAQLRPQMCDDERQTRFVRSPQKRRMQENFSIQKMTSAGPCGSVFSYKKTSRSNEFIYVSTKFVETYK